MELKDKVVVVTGATGGIGSAVVRELVKENARLVLVGHEAVAPEVPGSQYFSCDLTSYADLEHTAQNIAQRHTTIDVLINCAGIGIYKPIAELTKEDWDKTISLNLSSPFFMTKLLLPAMQRSAAPLVLNIGSGMGVLPKENRAAYCASKFGLRGLTLSLAEEFAGKKPDFCLITLGSTLTGFAGMSVEEKAGLHKNGRAYFTPEWVANRLLAIIKDDNRETEYKLFPSDFGFGTWE